MTLISWSARRAHDFLCRFTPKQSTRQAPSWGPPSPVWPNWAGSYNAPACKTPYRWVHPSLAADVRRGAAARPPVVAPTPAACLLLSAGCRWVPLPLLGLGQSPPARPLERGACQAGIKGCNVDALAHRPPHLPRHPTQPVLLGAAPRKGRAGGPRQQLCCQASPGALCWAPAAAAVDCRAAASGQRGQHPIAHPFTAAANVAATSWGGTWRNVFQHAQGACGRKPGRQQATSGQQQKQHTCSPPHSLALHATTNPTQHKAFTAPGRRRREEAKKASSRCSSRCSCTAVGPPLDPSGSICTSTTSARCSCTGGAACRAACPCCCPDANAAAVAVGPPPAAAAAAPCCCRSLGGRLGSGIPRTSISAANRNSQVRWQHSPPHSPPPAPPPSPPPQNTSTRWQAVSSSTASCSCARAWAPSKGTAAARASPAAATAGAARAAGGRSHPTMSSSTDAENRGWVSSAMILSLPILSSTPRVQWRPRSAAEVTGKAGVGWGPPAASGPSKPVGRCRTVSSGGGLSASALCAWPGAVRLKFYSRRGNPSFLPLT